MPLRDYQGDDDCAAVEARMTADAYESPLDQALAELPTSQRDALELRVVEELPYRDVASQLGCSESAARLYVSRALRSLRTRLQGVRP